MNLVFGGLLNNHGFFLVFESNKFVLTKKGIFMVKDYVDGGMIKFHVIANKPNINDMNNPSTYLFDFFNV